MCSGVRIGGGGGGEFSFLEVSSRVVVGRAMVLSCGIDMC